MSKKVLYYNNVNTDDIEVCSYLKIGNIYFDYKLNKLSKNDIKNVKSMKAFLQNPDGFEPFSVEEIKQHGYYFLGKYGFKDKDGNVIIEPKYILAYPFRFGFARVATEAFYDKNKSLIYKFNYINKKGDFVFDDYFCECTDFTKYHTAIAWDKNNSPLIVTKEGNKIDENKFKFLYPIKNYDTLYNPNVSNYTECRFYKYSYEASDVGNGNLNRLFGLYDSKKCTIAQPPKYKDFVYYSHNLVYAKNIDEQEIIIDKCGNRLKNERYKILDFYNYDILIDLENQSVSVFDSSDIDSLSDMEIL